MSVDSETLGKRPVTDLVMSVFLRLVALSCLYFGARIWGMLIGYADLGTGRFDLLAFPIKTAATTLAVLYPVAATGLWLRASWGPVIWVGIAAIELASHQVWPGIFGSATMMSVMIIAIMLLYVGLRLAVWRERFAARKARENAARALPTGQG